MRRFRLPTSACRLCALTLVVVPTTRTAAQTLIGVVRTREDLRPAVGAIVVLTDSSNRPVAGDVADSVGHFSVRAPRAGRYGVRVERIGLRAVVAPPIALGAGQSVDLPIDVATETVALHRVRIDADSRCDVRPREGTPGELAAWLWDEARKALTATRVSDTKRTTPIEITDVVRWLDPRTGRVLREETLPVARVRGQPFASVSPESLAAHGYVEEHGDSTVYAAPDAATLLDARFLDQHCLAARASRDDRPGLVGLAFRPARGTSRPDVSGVLWLDASSFELRFLEFGYTAPDSLANPEYGGRVDFTRLHDGRWIVRRWALRVPGALNRSATGSTSLGARRRSVPAIREEIQEVSPASLATLGVAAPAPAAQLPSLDSLARLACAGSTSDSTGLVAGIARHGATGVPVAGAEVEAEWLGFVSGGGATPRAEPISMTLHTDRDGRFALCAAPGGALVTLTARFGDRLRSAPEIVRAVRGVVTPLELLIRGQ